MGVGVGFGGGVPCVGGVGLVGVVPEGGEVDVWGRFLAPPLVPADEPPSLVSTATDTAQTC